jgi:uncharacterized protein with von Willebrand factor type A (vWA) domain
MYSRRYQGGARPMASGRGRQQVSPQELKARIVQKLMNEEGMSEAEAMEAAEKIMARLMQQQQGQQQQQQGQQPQMMKKGGKVKKKRKKKSPPKYKDGGSTFGVQGGRSPFS